MNTTASGKQISVNQKLLLKIDTEKSHTQGLHMTMA